MYPLLISITFSKLPPLYRDLSVSQRMYRRSYCSGAISDYEIQNQFYFLMTVINVEASI